MLDHAQALQEQLIAWRRDFHAHPELNFQETRTAGIVADTLRDLGLHVETGIAKTGVIGHLGEGSPVVAIRADMDALPIQEENDVPYASQNPGMMHACGHDAHTAILLGVAHLLAGMDDRPPGELRFLFQPAEEDQDADGKSGGMLMVEEGALDGVDAAIALHVSSDMPAGKIQITPRHAMAAVDTFDATIKGYGCHGAYPHKGVDPIFILAQVINAVHGIRARRVDPVRPAVISIGTVHAGEATNVIPDRVDLRGTIRSFDEGTRQQLFGELEQAFEVARALGGDYNLAIVEGYVALYNDPGVSDLIATVAKDLFGPEVLLPPEPGMGSEDFAYMAREAPGAMFYLGARRDEIVRPHHSPIFDLNESVFHIGAAILAEASLRLLRQRAVRAGV